MTAPGTPIDREKIRSVGVISRRSGPRIREGREHPETHVPFKATTDELGNTTTEHATADDRVDVQIRPQIVRSIPAVNGTSD